MKRLNDNFLETIDAKLHLHDKVVLEVGCGSGAKSAQLAKLCKQLTAIDPSKSAITNAETDFSAKNLTYAVGQAEDLKFADESFDLVVFSLSLHHVPIHMMPRAIAEAARVAKPKGKIIFLEPTFNGTFFDAELLFGASDGDERKEKAAAYFELLSTKMLHEDLEFYDTIQFEFDSKEDFIENMEPKTNLDKIHQFLEGNQYVLHAQRRINVFSLAESA